MWSSNGRTLGHGRTALHNLTSKEEAIMSLIEQGMTVREIAKRRGIAYETARFHVRNILRKAGARSQKQLIGMIHSDRRN